jgi:hypothetical protein
LTTAAGLSPAPGSAASRVSTAERADEGISARRSIAGYIVTIW